MGDGISCIKLIKDQYLIIKMNINIIAKWTGIIAAGVLGGLFYSNIAKPLAVGLAQEEKIHERCWVKEATPVSYHVSTKNIDQVFRDHGGFRIYSQDSRREVIEETYGNSIQVRPVLPESVRSQFIDLKRQNENQVKIYRDLETGAQPYAKILEFTVPGCVYYGMARGDENLEGKLKPFYYVEAHLPRNQGIAAGIDSWVEGKIQKYEPMGEIK